ncbi:hypothetical protein GUITHDRAFT_152703 [Guillardia theta CCMP2712]|uniref:Uncharacterized protein n=1 Tax=Guillardia theta (strain CCMP2712) TaxID=905079 RepID=L1JB86_GUITC|nr:hypothetical protein GUITHDRAFT_152703 [Guillardia theta CCMP2712]EKX45379.1 hypothetical protein GUITHDRAFT_152703 [Guillardia theta CCMP2712]|eukprot:XP_005832359.1 hypothetical protein GUITHDRAFT_152703 [Guillardia theta CCMP2712]
MAILNIRQAKSSSLSSSKDKASNLPHRTSTESLRPANARSHEGAGGEQNEGYVLEKRVIINMVRILSSAIDEMPFAGVKFSPEAALFSFPAAVQHRANVAVFCDQGLVELLLSLIQRHRPASTGGEGDSAQKSDPTQADTADKVEGGKDETNIRLIELALQTMLTMSKTEGGAGHECLQRMNLLNSQELLQGLAGWSVNRTEEAPKVERVARLATEVRDLLSQAGS